MEVAQAIWEHPLAQFFLVLFATLIGIYLLNRSVHQFFQRTNFIEVRKEKTLESMIKSLLRYTATIGLILYGLSFIVDDFGKVLAGAGIVGIIVGFGAQSLIRDLLSGIFLIYEKQLHKGDFITVNNTFNGTVEDIGLRFLKVREWSGKLLTISNGEVKQIQNYNIDRMRVIERAVISYRENPEEIFSLLEEVCGHLNHQLDHTLKKDLHNQIIEPFQVFGITTLNASFRGHEYTVTGLVDDLHYWEASKIARKVLAQTLFNKGIRQAEEHHLLNNDEIPLSNPNKSR
ncbi:small-conductance mechanosensitive channel [Bacillus mesophilus]|uniref:Mechanosensitive ion channel family protein n=1 Tax=Bacillus mesophilus TaxID=1808955 RepID=A0A6M0QDT7_9BACI|nr:mechanosensitive ion channel family protein [Bacillus mesophilus]MBM7662624.1 small-conductance mechanosensitive channel [Bacillus mesophilus]NEY73308.1 mechanosensitive ion channel family protein [Bacillus mesophilus]